MLAVTSSFIDHIQPRTNVSNSSSLFLRRRSWFLLRFREWDVGQLELASDVKLKEEWAERRSEPCDLRLLRTVGESHAGCLEYRVVRQIRRELAIGGSLNFHWKLADVRTAGTWRGEKRWSTRVRFKEHRVCFHSFELNSLVIASTPRRYSFRLQTARKYRNSIVYCLCIVVLIVDCLCKGEICQLPGVVNFEKRSDFSFVLRLKRSLKKWSSWTRRWKLGRLKRVQTGRCTIFFMRSRWVEYGRSFGENSAILQFCCGEA